MDAAGFSSGPSTGAGGVGTRDVDVSGLGAGDVEEGVETSGTGAVGTVLAHPDPEAGMATAEYAIATLAAAAFAGVLLVILRSGEVREFLMSIIRQALSV